MDFSFFSSCFVEKWIVRGIVWLEKWLSQARTKPKMAAQMSDEVWVIWATSVIQINSLEVTPGNSIATFSHIKSPLVSKQMLYVVWTSFSDLIGRGYFKLFPKMFERKCVKKAHPGADPSRLFTNCQDPFSCSYFIVWDCEWIGHLVDALLGEQCSNEDIGLIGEWSKVDTTSKDQQFDLYILAHVPKHKVRPLDY